MTEITSIYDIRRAHPTHLTDLGGPLAVLESDAAVWWQIKDFNNSHDAWVLAHVPPPLYEKEVTLRYAQIMHNKRVAANILAAFEDDWTLWRD